MNSGDEDNNDDHDIKVDNDGVDFHSPCTIRY